MASGQTHSALQTVGIILAAGKGTRMKSQRPKVLFEAAGRSLLDWVRTSLRRAGVTQHCVVLSEDLQGFEELLSADLTIGIQKNRLGTGDAVASMAPCFSGVDTPPYASGRLHHGTVLAAEAVIVCAGDVPCVRPESYRAFVTACEDAGAPLGVLGMKVEKPTGYGRLVLDDSGMLQEIVEEKDATDRQRQIDICNTGIIYAKTSLLFQWLSQLTNENASREYYLTDCVGVARNAGHQVHAFVMDDEREFLGVNNRAQLAAAEATLMERKRHELMVSGVSLRLPETIAIDADVEVQPETMIGANVSLTGKTTVGGGCVVGHGSYLEDVVVKDGVTIGPGCVLQQCEVQESLPAGTVRES